MLTSEVKLMEPLDRFVYWISERHRIYYKKEILGEERPWTDDEVLDSWFFTNPYREHDKVTVWFNDWIREPLRDSPEVIFATICFRWFNWPATGHLLIEHDLLQDWDKERALRVLRERRDAGDKIFTGAFMINSPPGVKKLEAICERIDNVWQDLEELVFDLDWVCTLEDAHKRLMVYPGLAGFMAYEVVCDLRWTHVLENAIDVLTWANPGPGAYRGLLRLVGRAHEITGNASTPTKVKDPIGRMRELLEIVEERLLDSDLDFPPLELREIEHSLCEFDKMERALWGGQGKMKRRYRG